MQKKDVVKFFKKKGTIVAMSLCLVGGVAAASYYTMEMTQNAKEKEQNLVDLNEEPETQKMSQKQNTSEKSAVSGQAQSEVAEEKSAPTLANDMDVDPATLAEDQKARESSEKSASAENNLQNESSVDANSSNVQAKIQPTVDFQESNTLTWPVAGTVLMDYSMDSTVYFKTLNVYKYNPALIIGSEVNAQVLASARGIVDSVVTSDETGTTLTLNIGNDYKLVYGQLKEVSVSEGDVVDAGGILGYVSEPTKYYCEEGSNLYFEMMKDGEPVDPFLYLE